MADEQSAEPGGGPLAAPDAAPDDSTLDEQEMVTFGIIASSGEARGLAFEALEAAQAGDFAQADELLAQSDAAALEAHHQQTTLLTREAQGDHTPVDVLLVHAQDHLMTSMLAQELIAEMVKVYASIDELRKQLERS